MADGATVEDVLSGEPVRKLSFTEAQKEASSGELTQLGENPLAGIDFAKAEAMNKAYYEENKRNSKVKREYLLKRLFLQYARKYALKWNAVLNYPKQIKQKPAWFDLALSLFKESEISQVDKKKISLAFNRLWEYRDRMEPERVLPEEESLRQYGVTSPYYQQPEAEYGGLQPSEELLPSDVLTTPQPEFESRIASDVEREVMQAELPQPQQTNVFGVRTIKPEEHKDYLSGYIGGFGSRVVDLAPFPVKKGTVAPQGEFDVGATKSVKNAGNTGGGAFSIGRNMFSSFSTGGILKSAMTPTKPTLPSAPVTTVPPEVTPIGTQPVMPTPPAVQSAPVVQRKKKRSLASVDRTTSEISTGLAKFRNIEMWSMSDMKMKDPKLSVIKKRKAKTTRPVKRKSKGMPMIKGLPKIKSRYQILNSSGKIKSSATFNKGSIGTMSNDIKSKVGGVVGGIKALRGQVRGEFRDKSILKELNLKNIKSNKVKTNKDLNVLNKLKTEAYNTMSQDALECKMVPKLREQCDKVFKKNKLTGEVSKFRNEFKDIAKTVPTVRGDKARIKEVGMLGGLVSHGVASAQVDGIKDMYKNSGSTKQMKIGMVEYDYSFATGKKKQKPIMEEEVIYEEEY